MPVVKIFTIMDKLYYVLLWTPITLRKKLYRSLVFFMHKIQRNTKNGNYLTNYK